VEKTFQNLLKLLLILNLTALFVLLFHSHNTAQVVSIQKKKKIFENNISDIAERYVGIPYKFGGDLEKSKALDNSNLFCLIYEKAAKGAGLRFKRYMPIKELFRNTVKVQQDELRNGDLMVLNDGHAAMIYKFENRDIFHLVYASLKRQQVISFNSKNIVYEVYWLKNLKGFYRLTADMVYPADQR